MNVKQIKERYTCLDYLGKPLKRTVGGWYIYRSPWREDKHPSLNVTPDGKVWHDLATGAKGNLIELVMTCLNTKDLGQVCAAFNSSSFCQSRTFDEKKEKNVDANRFKSFKVVPLQSRGLYAYLNQRKVNISIARQFLQEAHYSFKEHTDGNYLYALAYPNDKGGYELRSSHFKGGTSPKGISTHWNRENAPTIVFEGFFDMLSFATLCGEVKHNYIVLNSIINADNAIDVLQSHDGKVFLCLDNDDAGRATARKMIDALPSAIDISTRFVPYKDVNEFLCELV